MVACEKGDYTQAQACLKQIAGGVRELKGTPLPAMFFTTAARLAGMTGLLERAARLAGAAQTALSQANADPGTSNRAEYEAVWAAIRRAVSEEVADRACAEGQAMSLEAALAYATDGVTHT